MAAVVPVHQVACRKCSNQPSRSHGQGHERYLQAVKAVEIVEGLGDVGEDGVVAGESCDKTISVIQAEHSPWLQGSPRLSASSSRTDSKSDKTTSVPSGFGMTKR